MENQSKLTPSSFRYIAECYCWERKPSPPNEAMLRGTAMDTLLRNYIHHNMTSLDGLASDKLKPRDYKAVQWAGDSIRNVCGENKVRCLKSDCKFKFVLDDVLISGEMDAYCPEVRTVFDLKSGRVRDYAWQMLPYAYYTAHTDNLDSVTTSLVFCDFKLLKNNTLSLGEIDDTLGGFVANWKSPSKAPRKCSACAYCKHFNERENKCMWGA